jgi:ABC-2 type transport system permease protein
MKTDILRVTGYSPFKTLLLREFWENRRSMFYGPIVGGGISLFLILIALFGTYIGIQTTDVEINGVNYYSIIDMLDQYDRFSPEKQQELMGLSMVVAVVFIGIIAWFSMIFNSLSCLYDERKDNSILFWKSMPVSDLKTVAAKTVSNLVVTPLVALAFAYVTQLLVVALISLIAIVRGYNAWDLFIGPANLPGLFLTELAAVVMYSLWALPVFAYLILASAFAKRTPLLTAAIPPVVIIVGEFILYGQSYLAYWIGNQLNGLGVFVTSADGEDVRISVTEAMNILQSASLPSFWTGLVIAATLLYAAAQLRKRSNQ